jgi:hypothetical protein
MNVLNRIGGAFLLLGLGIAVIIGFQTPTGRQIWDGLWQATATIVDYVRSAISGFAGHGTSGDLAASIGVAAVVMVAVMVFIKGTISYRLFSILLVLATILAFLLYNPGIVG